LSDWAFAPRFEKEGIAGEGRPCKVNEMKVKGMKYQQKLEDSSAYDGPLGRI